jgi:Domain of unknown function (DUF6898)
MAERDGRGEVIIELVRLGGLVRASALDPESLIEVTLQGPAAAGETVLRQAVLRKLDYVLGRRRAGAHARPLARHRSLL